MEESWDLIYSQKSTLEQVIHTLLKTYNFSLEAYKNVEINFYDPKSLFEVFSNLERRIGHVYNYFKKSNK